MIAPSGRATGQTAIAGPDRLKWGELAHKSAEGRDTRHGFGQVTIENQGSVAVALHAAKRPWDTAVRERHDDDVASAGVRDRRAVAKAGRRVRAVAELEAATGVQVRCFHLRYLLFDSAINSSNRDAKGPSVMSLS